MKKHLLTIAAGFLFALPLYGYAEELPQTVLGVATSTKEEATTTISIKTFTACSQEAIEARDTKIAASRLTYNTAMANALTERKNREKAAVAILDEDDKKDAIKASIETYKHQAKTAQATLTQARKLAWQTFDNDIKACRDLEQETDDASQVTKAEEEQVPAARTMMMKKGSETETADTKAVESKSFKETIKDKFESIKSLFN